MPSVIEENLSAGVKKFLSVQVNELKQGGDDAEELRKRFTEETVNQILADRADELGYNDIDETIIIGLLGCNIKIFNFYITHCKNLFCFAGMGGAVSFDWQIIFSKAKIAGIKINKNNLIKLEAIEGIVLSHINKNVSK